MTSMRLGSEEGRRARLVVKAVFRYDQPAVFQGERLLLPLQARSHHPHGHVSPPGMCSIYFFAYGYLFREGFGKSGKPLPGSRGRRRLSLPTSPTSNLIFEG